MEENTTLRNADGSMDVIGILSEKKLDLVTNNDGSHSVRGYLVLKCSDVDFVTINVWINEFTAKGQPNNAYTGIQTVMTDHKSIADVGEAEATRIHCKRVQVRPNSYVGKEDLMVHENVQYSGSYFSRVDDNNECKADLQIEGYVQSIVDEFDFKGESTGRLIVKLCVPTYRGVEPMEVIVSETIAETFKDTYEPGQTGKFYGYPVNRNIVKEKVIHMAMGGDRVEKSSRRTSEIVINQAIEPYDDGRAFDPEAIRAGLVERDLRLQEDKKRMEAEKKSGTAPKTSAPAAATPNRTLPRFTGGFNM